MKNTDNLLRKIKNVNSKNLEKKHKKTNTMLVSSWCQRLKNLD